MDRIKKLRHISEKLFGQPNHVNLLKAHMYLIKEGNLAVIMCTDVGSKNSMKAVVRRIFLFSELILVVKVIGQEPHEKFHYKSSFTLASINLEEIGNNPESKEFGVGNARSYIAFRCKDLDEKNDWMKIINDQVTKLKKIRATKQNIR